MVGFCFMGAFTPNLIRLVKKNQGQFVHQAWLVWALSENSLKPDVEVWSQPAAYQAAFNEATS